MVGNPEIHLRYNVREAVTEADSSRRGGFGEHLALEFIGATSLYESPPTQMKWSGEGKEEEN